MSSPSDLTASRASVKPEGPSFSSAESPNGGNLAQRVWREARTPQGTLRVAWALTILLIVIFIGLVGQHAVTRYQAFHSDAFDLGNMNQAVWNTLHGHPFRFTNRGFDWHGPPTRLGIHVEPIILLIAPLYLIHGEADTLIVLQTVMLGLGGIPLFLLSLRRLPELPLVGTALVGAYLIAPEMVGEALWDFHPVALATPLLILAIWALDSRRYRWFVVAAVLAIMTKEDVGLAIVPLGLYVALWRGKPRLGWALALGSVVWVALCFLVILPHFNGGASGGNNYWYRYSWAGTSAGDAARNILTHPWLPLFFVLGDNARRGYLAGLLRTGGGLGLLSPVALICALPELAVNVLSSHPEQYSGFFQYNAMLLAFLMTSAVYGAATLYHARVASTVAPFPLQDSVNPKVSLTHGGQWIARAQRFIETVARRWKTLLGRIPLPTHWIGPLLVVWLIIASVWNLSVTSPRRERGFWDAGGGYGPTYAQVEALMSQVPDNASVAATDTLDPRLSSRYTIYLMPDPQSYQADYVAVNIPAAAPESQGPDQRMVARMEASGHYVVVGQVGTVLLLRRIGPPLPSVSQG